MSAEPASAQREREAEMGSGNSQAELRAAGWERSQTKAEREQSPASAFPSCISTVQEPEKNQQAKFSHSLHGKLLTFISFVKAFLY